MAKLAWHYTTCAQEHLGAILQSGKLAPMGAYVESGERAALWFSMNQVWEATASKAVRAPNGKEYELSTMDEVHKVMGVVRIGVDPAKVKLCGFDSFVRRSGISRSGAKNLRAAGREAGASPYDWRASFEPIPAAQWTAIEVWDGERWTPHSLSEASEAIRTLDVQDRFRIRSSRVIT